MTGPAIRTVRVHTAGRSYDVVIGHGIIARLPQAMQRLGVGTTIGLVTDAVVADRWLGQVQRALTKNGFKVVSVTVRPGERRKSLRTVEAVTGRLLKAGLGRDACLLALGGGVVGDLAGFVAATYQRGIPLIQVPTTLLSQVDSAIGGKVGVNHVLGKNMIGAFYQPSLVWSDTSWLRSLPRRELIAGLGEVIKYGIIRDKGLFSWLERHLTKVLAHQANSLRFIVERSAAIKGKIVAADERERHLRMILNFGHTAGHGLEAAGGYVRLKHGEAVLLGMRIETRIALWMGLLPDADARRIQALIGRLDVPTPRLSLSDILAHMGRDKKNRQGTVRFILPTSLGRVEIVDHVDRSLVVDAIRSILPTRP